MEANKKYIFIAYTDIYSKPAYFGQSVNQNIKSYQYDKDPFIFEYITYECDGKYVEMSDDEMDQIIEFIGQRLNSTNSRPCLCLLHVGSSTRLSFSGRQLPQSSGNCKIITFSGGAHLVNKIVDQSTEFLPADETAFRALLQTIWDEYELTPGQFNQQFLNNL